MIAHVTGDSRIAEIVPCVLCGQEYTIYVSPRDMREFLGGFALIEDVMPYLTASEHKMLITGICDKCFDKLADILIDNENDVE